MTPPPDRPAPPASALPAADPARISIVVLTHNRVHELDRCLARLLALPERAPVIVVDNASQDGTADHVRRAWPQVQLVHSPRNLGAAARNLGVEQVRTPYVAFCDDDTWWAPGALARAVALLDAHPRVGVLNARVLVGPDNRPDPTCDHMAASPVPSGGLPGPALIGFMAGAVVMRTRAFREAGGYERRFFLGAEEALLALDLQARGWAIVYAQDVVTHHHPSPARDRRERHIHLARNGVWLAWMRMPWPTLWHQTVAPLRRARDAGVFWPALRAALRGLPWAWARREPLPPQVHAHYLMVHPNPPPRRRAAARRPVLMRPRPTQRP